MTALPSWIPQQHWDEWLAMRKKIRKPATDFACMLAVKELYALKAQGHDPVKCLEQSILKCWLAFYPPKPDMEQPAGERPGVTDYEKTQERQRKEDEHKQAVAKEDLAENARKARERFGRKPAQGELH